MNQLGKTLGGTVAAAALTLTAGVANAQFVVPTASAILVDEGAQAALNIPGTPNYSASDPIGLFQVTRPQYVIGVPNPPVLFDVVRQDYFIGVNGAPEVPVSSLSLNSLTTNDTDADGDVDRARVSYSGTGFKLDIFYSLRGSTVFADGQGSNKVTVNRTVLVTNTSFAPIDIRLYSYNYWELTDGFGDTDPNGTGYQYPDHITVLANNTIRQSDFDTGPSGPADFNMVSSDMQTTVLPDPDHVEIGIFQAPGSILDRLEDGVADDLADSPIGSSISLANVEFAFQWNETLAPFGQVGSSLIVLESTLIVPEPASLALMASSALLMFRRRRA